MLLLTTAFGQNSETKKSTIMNTTTEHYTFQLSDKF